MSKYSLRHWAFKLDFLSDVRETCPIVEKWACISYQDADDLKSTANKQAIETIMSDHNLGIREIHVNSDDIVHLDQEKYITVLNYFSEFMGDPHMHWKFLDKIDVGIPARVDSQRKQLTKDVTKLLDALWNRRIGVKEITMHHTLKDILSPTEHGLYMMMIQDWNEEIRKTQLMAVLAYKKTLKKQEEQAKLEQLVNLNSKLQANKK
jgi:hypothetical protein